MEKYRFSRLFYLFLLTGFTLHIFILDLKIPDASYVGVENWFYQFYLTLWLAMEEFDVIWIISAIFIYYFYEQVYFIGDPNSWKKKILVMISIFLSIIILIGTSFYYYGNLKMIFCSFIQVYKCFMVGIGYYFMIYAILKKIFLIRSSAS